MRNRTLETRIVPVTSPVKLGVFCSVLLAYNVETGHEFRQPPRVFPRGAAISLSNTRRKLSCANG